MTKRTVASVILLAALVLGFPQPNLYAQFPTGGGASLGPVDLDWQHAQILNNSNRWILSGGVHMTSANYDLKAETVTVDLSAGGKKAGAFNIAKATADGDRAKNTQVAGRFESVEPARTYLVNGDHAVYTPDAGRVNGGKIDFTGNVVIRITDPQALSGDAVTHVEHAIVTLGQGPDYPQFEFSAGHLEATPLQKEH